MDAEYGTEEAAFLVQCALIFLKIYKQVVVIRNTILCLVNRDGENKHITQDVSAYN